MTELYEYDIKKKKLPSYICCICTQHWSFDIKKNIDLKHL